ncbi:MAG: ATP-binding protein [Clostridia bacterium]
MEQIEQLNGLQDDEFLLNGLPYCKNCNTARFYQSPDKLFLVRCICKCQAEKVKEEEEKNKLVEKQYEFFKRQQSSLLGKRYLNISFEKSIKTKNISEAYNKLLAYSINSKEMFANNIGLYLYGAPSSGKTHLSACLCNELVNQGYYCLYTNLSTILNEISATFNNSNNTSDILKKIASFSFVFIDDVGKEFLGREFNASSAKWAEKTLFEILNTRYNAQLPTIFTSNFSLKELSTKLNLDDAIVDRINEMATRLIKIDGDDFRELARENKSELAKNLGV